MRLSKEHGLNPSILKCPICGKDGDLVLFGAAWKGEAPMYVKGQDPCEKCRQDLEGFREQGFLFIVLSNEAESLKENKGFTPWLYFKYLVVLKRDCDLVKSIKVEHQGAVFMGETEARKIGIMPVEKVKSKTIHYSKER